MTAIIEQQWQDARVAHELNIDFACRGLVGKHAIENGRYICGHAIDRGGYPLLRDARLDAEDTWIVEHHPDWLHARAWNERIRERRIA